MSGTSDSKPSWGRTCAEWWLSLQPYRRDGLPNRTADPGALARLRRASSPLDAAKELQTIVLYRKLHGATFDARKLEATAVVAAVLSGIRADRARHPPDASDAAQGSEAVDNAGAQSTAELLGNPRKGEGKQPVMSPLRMRRLTSARDAKATLRGFREVVALLDGNAPVADVAVSILDWLDDSRSDRRKTRWLYDYYSAVIADLTRDGEPDAAGPAGTP